MNTMNLSNDEIFELMGLGFTQQECGAITKISRTINSLEELKIEMIGYGFTGPEAKLVVTTIQRLRGGK